MENNLEQLISDARNAYGIDIMAESYEDAIKKLRGMRKELERLDTNRVSYGNTSRPSTLNEQERTVEVSIASEMPVLRFDWVRGEFVDEILPMDTVDLSRCPDGIPFINSHDRFSIENILGTTRNIHVEGDKLVGTRFFSSTSELAFTLAKEGHLKGQSIGYRVHTFTYIERGCKVKLNEREWEASKDRRLRVATSWEPLEDSAVIIPADHTTGMRGIEQEQPKEGAIKMENKENEGKNIEKEITEAKRQAIESERSRVNEIREMALGLKLDEDFIRAHTLDSVDDFRKAAITHLSEINNNKASTPPAGHIDSQRDSYDRCKDAILDSILVREGLLDEEKANKDFADFYHYGPGMMMSLAKRFLDEHNVKYSSKDLPEEIFSRAISTGDFADLLTSTVKRSVKIGWDIEDDTTYLDWTGKAKASDFRTQTVVGALAKVDYREVKEGGEYSYATMTSDKLTFNIAKFGRKVAFTWEAIINDDLSQLTVLPAAIARGYRSLEADMAYNFLLNNPNFEDGTALFHANHGNLAGSGAVPSEATINAARNAMALQKDKAGNLLRLKATALIAPVALQQTFDKLLDSERFTDGNAASTQTNTVYKAFTKRVYEPRLDAAYQGSNFAWFLAANPMYGVKIVHLDGYETPTITTKESFDIDGFETKVRHVVGAYAESYQAFYKNPGTSI